MTARRKPPPPAPEPTPAPEPAQFSARLLSRAARFATTHKVDFNISIAHAVTLDIPQVSAVLDYLNGRAVAQAVAPYIEKLQIKEHEMAKLTADIAKLRKSLDKLKAAKAKADADELAEDEAAAADRAKFEEQISALQERLANVPPQPTPEEKAQAEKDQAELDAVIAEFDALDGEDEEPAPEPTPEPTPDDGTAEDLTVEEEVSPAPTPEPPAPTA